MRLSHRFSALALLWLIVPASLAQVPQMLPQITGNTPAAGDTVIKGGGAPTTTATATDIYICVYAVDPRPLVPCNTPNAVMLIGAMGDHTRTDSTGAFTATLANKLVQGQFVFVTEISTPTGGKAGTPQNSAEVKTVVAALVPPPPPPAAPILLGTPTAGQNVITGIAVPPPSQIFVCISATAPVPPLKSCAAGANPAVLITSPPVPPALCPASAPAAPVVPGTSVAPLSTGAFCATLQTPLVAGSYVYVTQVSGGTSVTSANAIAVAPALPTTVAVTLDNAAPTTLDPNTFSALVTGTPSPSLGNPIAGTVQFMENGLPFGMPIEVKPSGVAILNIDPKDPAALKGAKGAGKVYPITATFTPALGQPYAASISASTNLTLITAPNEREHTDFVAGSSFAADGSNYSQGNIFLALNYDRAIWRPGWYDQKDQACDSTGKRAKLTAGSAPVPMHPCAPRRTPGLNTFFQARLTTIPVNGSQTTVQTTTPASGTSTPASSSTQTTSISSFLSAQKTAQFSGGGYMPFIFGKVPSIMSRKDKTETFFIGPLASFGFSTPSSSPGNATTSAATNTAGMTTTTVTTPTTLGTNAVAADRLYNYWLGGARIGTADLGIGSLHVTHYFDVGIGKFNNLQSLICLPRTFTVPGSPTVTGTATTTTNMSYATAFTNGSCQTTVTTTTTSVAPTLTTTTSSFTVGPDPTKESRSTLLRLVFEGYMEVQTTTNTSLILGISANYGPGVFSRNPNVDPANRAKDDLGFLIGYKFDVTKLLSAIPVLGN